MMPATGQGGSVPKFQFVPMNDDTHLRVLRLIEQNRGLSQRDMARELGVSLGKTNYCLRALLEKGWVKARNFKNNDRKLQYAYLLTPSGIENKARLTANYLQAKMAEYERLRLEIEQLKEEVVATGQDVS
jgi:EPS-associated MarR family transcriptional regulator